jgi:hypothetical protein
MTLKGSNTNLRVRDGPRVGALSRSGVIRPALDAG